MDKIIYPDEQDPLLNELDGHLSSFYESGRQVKSASSSVFSRKMMEQFMPDDNHFAVHYIALGSGEAYSFNKNGDHWPEKGLAHEGGNYGTHTFVKNGHYFREHRNRDPKLKIGDIKAAAYNPEMKRSEVIVWGDKKLAEKEYEKAKAGKTLTCSMSARVPGDTCSCCGNFAKSSKAYCTHLKSHMTQWMPKFGKFAYAINDEPNFFDLSDVENRADRIALQLEVMMPQSGTKSAAAVIVNGIEFSDERAKSAGILLPDYTTGCYSANRQRWLEKLCDAETYLEATVKSASIARDDKYEFVKGAAQYAFVNRPTEEQLEAIRKIEPSVLFSYLAKQAAVMPFNLFFAYTQRETLKQASTNPAYCYAQDNLMSALFRNVRSGSADYDMEQMFIPASSIKVAHCPIEDNGEMLLKQIVNENTIKVASVRGRALRNCAGGVTADREKKGDKSASYTDSDIDKAKVVAKAYALYKIAFVEAVADNLNDVDEAAVLLVNSQHQ